MPKESAQLGRIVIVSMKFRQHSGEGSGLSCMVKDLIRVSQTTALYLLFFEFVHNAHEQRQALLSALSRVSSLLDLLESILRQVPRKFLRR